MQPLTHGSAVAPGNANGKRVATSRAPRRQAGWRPVTGRLLVRHNQSANAAARARHEDVYGVAHGVALDRWRRCAPAGVGLDFKLGPRGSALALWLPSSGFLCSSNDVLNERRGGGELVGGSGGGRFALGTCGDAETGPARAAQRLGASG
eukprot:scaffold24913_cov73-Phaeocystis_antarctica.AAC.2